MVKLPQIIADTRIPQVGIPDINPPPSLPLQRESPAQPVIDSLADLSNTLLQAELVTKHVELTTKASREINELHNAIIEQVSDPHSYGIAYDKGFRKIEESFRKGIANPQLKASVMRDIAMRGEAARININAKAIERRIGIERAKLERLVSDEAEVVAKETDDIARASQKAKVIGAIDQHGVNGIVDPLDVERLKLTFEKNIKKKTRQYALERGMQVALDNPLAVVASDNLNQNFNLNLDAAGEVKVRDLATRILKDKEERIALLHKTERDQTEKEYLDLALKGDRREAVDLMIRKRDEGIFTAEEAGKKVDAVNDGKFERPSNPLTLARTKESIRAHAGLLTETDILGEVQRNPSLGMKDLDELQTLTITVRDEEYKRNFSSLKAELDQTFSQRGFNLFGFDVGGRPLEEIEAQALDEFDRAFRDNLLQQDPTKRILPSEIRRRVFEKVRNEVLPVTEEKANELLIKFQDDTLEKIERDLREKKISTKDAEVRLELLNRREILTQPTKKGQAKKASGPFDIRR